MAIPPQPAIEWGKSSGSRGSECKHRQPPAINSPANRSIRFLSVTMPTPKRAPGYTADVRDPVKRGSYLVTIGHCMECHSPRERGVSDTSRYGLARAAADSARRTSRASPPTGRACQSAECFEVPIRVPQTNTRRPIKEYPLPPPRCRVHDFRTWFMTSLTSADPQGAQKAAVSVSKTAASLWFMERSASRSLVDHVPVDGGYAASASLVSVQAWLSFLERTSKSALASAMRFSIRALAPALAPLA